MFRTSENRYKMVQDNAKYIREEDLKDHCYVQETGMEAALKQIALETLLLGEINGLIQVKTNTYRVIEKETYVTFNQLKGQLQKQYQRSLLFSLEEGFYSLEAIGNDEHYIQGFIAGYKFANE